MAGIGQKLETKGVIMTLLSLVLIGTGCEDKIDSSVVNLSEGKTVEVTLNIGIADEVDGAGASASPVSKAVSGNSNNRSAFEVIPVADMHTKAGSNIPDQLYNLEIIQYRSNGQIVSQTIGYKTVGEAITVSLTADTHSRLLIIARGTSSGFGSLSGKSLADIQNMTVKAVGSAINSIPTDATGSALANMPYYLYLEDVNIVSDEGINKIQSPEGSDVRLMLKRLAVKLSVNWTFAQSMRDNGYTLKEVKLCQVPAHYRLISQTESTDKWGDVYPTSVAEFIEFDRLKGTDIENGITTSQTYWIPANARGTSAYSTSPLYRNKTNANPAATYMEFVVDNSQKKERLYYRAYLGGNETTDFNLLENTNYHWTININKADYAKDPRIQLLDQTPVISSNLQPTANCFMMRPGTNISFNPYKHTSGTNGWNDYLTDGSSLGQDKTITKVEVLWQTKDAGTSGDLVMGYVIDNSSSNSNHENLVNLTDGSDINKARVHVKVPVTNGGNAVIAAKNSAGTIVWSWHLWITDYVPQGITSTINYQQAQEKTQNGSVHQYATEVFTSGQYQNKVMMDRNLCATGGGFPGSDASNLEFAKRYGYQYQWGRKDPFFCSVDGTTNEIKVIYNGDGEATAIKLTDYSASMLVDGNSIAWSIQHPMDFIKDNASWYNGNHGSGAHCLLYDNNGKKTLYDPCPNGWTIPYKSTITGITVSNANWYDGSFKARGSAYAIKGGRLHNLSGSNGVPDPITVHNTAWFSVTSFRSYTNGSLGAPTNGYIGFRDIATSGNCYYYYLRENNDAWTITNGSGQVAESVPYRCIQE